MHVCVRNLHVAATCAIGFGSAMSIDTCHGCFQSVNDTTETTLQGLWWLGDFDSDKPPVG